MGLLINLCDFYLVELAISYLNIIEIYPRQRIRNRWLVAYTLVRNPSLLNFTSTNLAKKSAVSFFESDEKEGRQDEFNEKGNCHDEKTLL